MNEAEAEMAAGALAAVVGSDPPPARRSVMADLLDEQFAAPKLHRTVVEQWVEDGPDRGHWEPVG